MKITNNIHRTLSIVAAVLSILVLFISAISSAISFYQMYQAVGFAAMVKNLLPFIFISLATIFSIVALLRGKKDVVAGVLLILAMLIRIAISITGVVSLISLFAVRTMMGDMFLSMLAGRLMNLFGAIVTVVFYVLLICECFAPGNISGSKMKVMLIVLPIFMAVLTALSNVVMQLSLLQAGFAAFVITAGTLLFSTMLSHIPVLLMGLAFSVPVYEKVFYGYESTAQTNYNI